MQLVNYLFYSNATETAADDGLTYDLDTAWGTTMVSALTGDSGYDGLYVYPATMTVNADGTVTVVEKVYQVELEYMMHVQV